MPVCLTLQVAKVSLGNIWFDILINIMAKVPGKSQRKTETKCSARADLGMSYRMS